MSSRVSPEAEKDLDEIETWTTEHWGSSAAANILEAILGRIGSLADFPFAGAPRPELGEGTRLLQLDAT